MIEQNFNNIPISSKKIIAREFLLLITTVFIGLVAYLAVFPYNSYKDNRAHKVYQQEVEKSVLRDSFQKEVNLIIEPASFKLHSYLKSEYNVEDYNIFLLDMQDMEKRKRLYQTLIKKEDYTKTFDEFNFQFFENIEKGKNYLTDNNEKIKRSKVVQDEKNALTLMREKIMSEKFSTETKCITENKKEKAVYSEQLNFSIKICFILFSLLFGLRYLFYSIKWSIKTLKQ